MRRPPPARLALVSGVAPFFRRGIALPAEEARRKTDLIGKHAPLQAAGVRVRSTVTR